jgi:FkbM family methyltransferase
MVSFVRSAIEGMGYDVGLFPPLRWTRRALRAAGIEISRYGPLSIDWSIAQNLAARRIETLIDVGGNRGQFGVSMRDLGFRGTIQSFEPVPEVRAELEKTARRDGNWRVHGLALAAATGRATFHVGAFDQTSSLKSVDPVEAAANPVLEVARAIEVELDTLDAFVARERIDPARTFLKIDVQGAEMEVLEGGRATLKTLAMLLTETSLVSAYAGGGRIEELLALLRHHGLQVAGTQPVYANPSRGLLLEVDVLALRPPAATGAA